MKRNLIVCLVMILLIFVVTSFFACNSSKPWQEREYWVGCYAASIERIGSDGVAVLVDVMFSLQEDGTAYFSKIAQDSTMEGDNKEIDGIWEFREYESKISRKNRVEYMITISEGTMQEELYITKQGKLFMKDNYKRGSSYISNYVLIYQS